VPLDANGHTAVEVSGGVIGSVVGTVEDVVADVVAVPVVVVDVGTVDAVVVEPAVELLSSRTRATVRPTTSATRAMRAAISHG
jgi:hypothetical protein